MIHAEAEGAETDKQQTHLIVALDASGSMGTCFSSVKETLSMLYVKLARLGPLASNTLYVFNNDTVKYDFTGLSLDQTCLHVFGLTVNGGTNFTSVLKAIQEHVHSGPPKACYFVVFLTGRPDNALQT